MNLAVLGVFKYANFFADNVNSLLFAAARSSGRRAARAAADRHLVLHLSRHLLRRRRLPARRDRRRRAPSTRRCTCCSFPQLIAGPIIRYRDIADQLARRTVSLDDFAYGVRRFIVGLARRC